MISSEKLAALEAAARSWVGTPFCEGAPVKGSGVCCHHLVAEIDFEVGFLARQPVPDGPPGWSRSQSRSLIAEWLDGSPDFKLIATLSSAPVELQPGDHVGFRLGLCVHHLGLMLGGGRMVHAVSGHAVAIAPAIPTPWKIRLEHVWRPVACL